MNDARWPVSVKGIVSSGDHVLLLLNERDEWELPGGRLESGESPEQCVAREIHEETGLTVTVEGIVDAWVYTVLPQREVLIVTYGCAELSGGGSGRDLPPLAVSDEHRVARWVPVATVADLPLPDGYVRSIQATLAAG